MAKQYPMTLTQLEAHEKRYLISNGWHSRTVAGITVWANPTFKEADGGTLYYMHNMALEKQKEHDRSIRSFARGAAGKR